jgi:hypothetical protein
MAAILFGYFKQAGTVIQTKVWTTVATIVECIGQRPVAAAEIDHRLIKTHSFQQLKSARLGLAPAVGKGIRKGLVEFAVNG